MKALEKDRDRRYGAAFELAADVQHYLDHEAVVARPASAGYRLSKYMRRHRVAVGVAAGLVLLSGIFSVYKLYSCTESRANEIALTALPIS